MPMLMGKSQNSTKNVQKLKNYLFAGKKEKFKLPKNLSSISEFFFEGIIGLILCLCATLF